jgi:hypothetical protein
VIAYFIYAGQKKWPSIICLAIIFMKQHQVVFRYQRLVLVLVSQVQLEQLVLQVRLWLVLVERRLEKRLQRLCQS